MRRILVAATCLMATFLVSPTPANAAATTDAQVARRTTKVKVTYPSAIRRGGPARFTYKVTHPDQMVDEALVLETDLPRGISPRVRFVTKPRGAKCGTQKRNSAGNYAVYCVIRSLNHSTITMSFNVWIKSSYRGKFRAGHYWAPVTLDYTGSTQDYLDEITKDDLIGNTWIKVP
ncbi:hypothetical protein [Microtetraspora sp. NBRC 16547]|uniref:hypothetical protein n=1 Tax=Microtetraspora sp. NBRC 16547 TaxID=3030993 RepID=UPI0024A1D8EF|nr:hypothetical protein [Microtetraspora sp. NBRC 16547]GLX02229.1 hypothetical protein Misp02_63150 [Microtetraspora sp. NBRC 16547]